MPKDNKDDKINFRVSKSEKEKIDALARKANVSTAKYVREAALGNNFYDTYQVAPLLKKLYEVQNQINALPYEQQPQFREQLKPVIEWIKVK